MSALCWLYYNFVMLLMFFISGYYAKDHYFGSALVFIIGLIMLLKRKSFREIFLNNTGE